jgi:hypothetical protein
MHESALVIFIRLHFPKISDLRMLLRGSLRCV